MNNDFELIKDAVANARRDEIEALVKGAIDKGFHGEQIINHGLIAGMDVIGQKYEWGQIKVPEMLDSAMTMKKALDIIKPILKTDQITEKATILMATVQGDNHDIGKSIVIMMLEAAGFRVVDLGVDVEKEKIAEKVEEIKPDILGLSALLTTTADGMKAVIKYLEEKGLRKTVKVIIGGAAVNASVAVKIGADGYGVDAMTAVELVKNIVKRKLKTAALK